MVVIIYELLTIYSPNPGRFTCTLYSGGRGAWGGKHENQKAVVASDSFGEAVFSKSNPLYWVTAMMTL